MQRQVVACATGLARCLSPVAKAPKPPFQVAIMFLDRHADFLPVSIDASSFSKQSCSSLFDLHCHFAVGQQPLWGRL